MNPTAITQSTKNVFAMVLEKIFVLNYKNIQVTDLTFSPRLNCLVGHNDEGKTNLSDAVYYLSFYRSTFNPVDLRVITHDRDFFILNGLYLNDAGDEERIYCGMKRGMRKRSKRNQKEYKRLSQHVGLVPLISVSPADITLIDSGNDTHRRFLDMVVSQLNHSYTKPLSRYDKALTQRNVLLKVG